MILRMALRMTKGWSKGKKRNPSASGRSVLAVCISGLGHGRQKDGEIGKSFLILLKRGMEQITSPTDAAWIQTGLLPERSGIRPHPVRQELPKAFLEEAPQKRVRNIQEQEKGEKDVVEVKDHCRNRNPKS